MTKPSKKPGLSSRQKLFLAFLQEAERVGSTFTSANIATTTGWKPDSVRAYLSEGHWNRVLVREGKTTFRSVGVLALSEREFHSRISQSRHVQSFAYGFQNALAASLLTRSRDNMVLALELFNRPSLANRLDGFVTLYCAAWEQMLKAELIERDGEDSIFEKLKAGQERRSIGLTEAIGRVFGTKTPVRSNLEEVQDIRDRAVHLLVPQLQPIAARLFQAGVFNYARHFRRLSGEPFVPHTSIGLLTLVADGSSPNAVNLRAAYGAATGDEVAALIDRLTKSVESQASWEYAVPISYRLMFSDKEGVADIILTKVAHDALDAKSMVVVEKTRERKHTHPHLPSAAVRMVADGLKAELSASQLSKHLVTVKDGVSQFTSHDFQALVLREGWRKSNNEFHHGDDEINRRWYSQRAVDTAIERVKTDPDYLRRARESYAAANKPGGSIRKSPSVLSK